MIQNMEASGSASHAHFYVNSLMCLPCLILILLPV